MVYIGNFLYLSNRNAAEEALRRHGEFSLIVEADGKDQALDFFRRKVEDMRRNSDFFEGSCSIFFNQLLEFDGFPDTEAAMLNFKSVAGDPVMPFIGCSMASEVSDNCRIYSWQEDEPAVDGASRQIFMEFEN